MTPVISPWVFYLMGVVDNFTIASILACIALIAIAIISFLVGIDEYNDEHKARHFKRVKHSILGVLIAVFLQIVIPSGNTITKLLIAQNVTYERVEVATDTVQTVYQDIMELFDNDSED